MASFQLTVALYMFFFVMIMDRILNTMKLLSAAIRRIAANHCFYGSLVFLTVSMATEVL